MTLSPSPLRKRVDYNELEIIARVAANEKRDGGDFVECGQETAAMLILVEDGYLIHNILLGTARSYLRFRLTEKGRKALALREMAS